MALLLCTGVALAGCGTASSPDSAGGATSSDAEQSSTSAAAERRRERRERARRARARARRKREQAARQVTTTTQSTSNCDPNYEGACLDPTASDYDCAGGSGDGPKYVQGPIQVVGDDHFDLDRDGDGVACES
jgi:hypothetical protein